MKKRKMFTIFSLGLLFMLSGCFGSSSSSSGSSDSGDKKDDTSEPVNNSDEYFTYDGSSVKAKDTSISGDLVIPSEFNGQSITTIPANAFKDCNQITSIVVPDSVTSISKGAFSGCVKLKSITLPFVGTSRTYTKEKDALFGEIFGDVNYSGSIKINQLYADWHRYIPSSLRKVTITDALTIGYKAFQNCSMLEEINLNDGIVSIDKMSFQNCSSVKTLNLPNINEIPEKAFDGCSCLEHFEISANIRTIGKYAFSKCAKLSRINSQDDGDFIIPKTINYISEGAFSGCIMLQSITLPFIGNSRVYEVSNYATYDYLFGRIFGGESYTGGTQTQQRWSYHYYYIPNGLRKVTITDASSIGEMAFQNCSMLTELNINLGAKTAVGKDAFKNCISPNYYSTVEINENIAGTIRLNGFTESGAVKEETKTMNINDEIKTSFNSSGCKYVYFSIYYDNYGEKVNVFDNWGMVKFTFKDADGNALFTSKDIEMKHNNNYFTDAFNHKMSLSDFNKLKTLELFFWYDKQDVLGASGNWSNQDYNVKNIKVVIQAI